MNVFLYTKLELSDNLGLVDATVSTNPGRELATQRSIENHALPARNLRRHLLKVNIGDLGAYPKTVRYQGTISS